jgi:hypothetical protein
MSHNPRALAGSGLPVVLMILVPVRYAMHPCPLTLTPARLTHPNCSDLDAMVRCDGRRRVLQHVTWRIAFVTSDFLASVSIASSIGRINRSSFRRRASRFTSSITDYLPVPTTRRWHFQGIFSSTETGVCPNSPRNFSEDCFLGLRNLPRSIT